MTSSEPPNDMTGPTRDGNGRFARTPQAVERDARAVELKARGMSFRAIAAELGVDVHTAFDSVKRVLDEMRREPAEQLRLLEVEKLDRMEVAVNAVLEREHITVSQGRIVRRRILDEDGDPIIVGRDRDDKPIFREEEVLDDAPVLQAVDRLLKIQQRRAALLGLDQPARVDVGGKLTYEILGVDMGRL